MFNQTLQALRSDLSILGYKAKTSLFQWRKDGDGDVALVVAGVIGFTKYKDCTIITFPGEKGFPIELAEKYQGRSK